MKTAVDAEGRERFVDPIAGARLVASARRDLAAARAGLTEETLTRSDLGRALQRLSEYLRMSGELEEALLLKERALEIWTALGRDRAAFLVSLQRELVRAELGEQPEFERLAKMLDADARLQPYARVLEDFRERAALVAAAKAP